MKITTLTLAVASIIGASHVYAASPQNESVSPSYINSSDWSRHVEMSGLVEVEAGTTSQESVTDENDITVATVEIALTAGINEWTTTEVVLLYEDSGDTALDIDSATLTLANPESNWSVTAGRTAIPFGVFDTQLISDPLTQEMGEAFENIILFDIESGAVNAGMYFFNGDIQDGGNTTNSFGAFVNYGMTSSVSEFTASLGYLNNIGDADGISTAVNDNGGNLAEHVAGIFVALHYSSGLLTLSGEYISASDDFEVNTLASTSEAASPSAYNLEAAYSFTLSGQKTTMAIAFQGTDEAEAIGMAETKKLLGLSMGVMKNMHMGFEVSSEEDYVGEKTDMMTAQLAVEF